MATALDIINSALAKIGILNAGETTASEDSDLCLDRLNALVDAWEMEGILGYKTVTTIFTLPANTTSRTIGAAQQINTARPVYIDSSSYSRLDNRDYPLQPVSQKEYNDISLKTTYQSTYPEVCWFDGGNPTGNVYFWPPTATSVEVHLVTPTTGGIATLTTDYGFPQGYQRALEFNLAVEIAPDFNQTASPFIVNAAINAKRLLKRRNSRTPQLRTDAITSNPSGASVADFYNGYL